MRCHRAQGARRPPAPVPTLRVRCDCDHNAAITILLRAWPAYGRDLGDLLSPGGHRRTGGAPRARIKPSAGLALGMTVSVSRHGYKLL